jgi:hypothetical protein
MVVSSVDDVKRHRIAIDFRTLEFYGKYMKISVYRIHLTTKDQETEKRVKNTIAKYQDRDLTNM